MQKFTYRVPRYTVDLPVRLRLDGQSITGRCREISQEGMKLEAAQPLPPNFCGLISLSYQGVALDIQARLTHNDGQQDGLKFVFASETERDALGRLVSRLSTAPGQSGPVLVD